MKLFTPAFLLGVVSALPSVREDDANYVPPLYAMIAKCVEYITYIDDDFWDANCMEYCWHMAHNPDSCGLTETVEDYDALIDCVLKRHGAVCATTRPSRSPASGSGVTTKKEDTPVDPTTEAAATSASVETREIWNTYCQNYIYSPDNAEWHAYCKEMCEHYTKNGWMHCWNSQNEHEFSQCVSSRHAECSYWNVVDPTVKEQCIQKIYESHGIGCLDHCDTCTGETVDEVYACAIEKAASGCKSTMYSPDVIPSPMVAAAKN